MSSACCVCGSPLSRKDKTSIDPSNPEALICQKCKDMKIMLETYPPTGDISKTYHEKAANYFRMRMIDQSVNPDVLDVLADLIGSDPDELNDIKHKYDLRKLGEEKLSDYSWRNNLMMTTGFGFEKHNVVEYHGTVIADSIVGTGLKSEISAGMADFAGFASETIGEKASLAKNQAIDKLARNAVSTGANAVIGVRIDSYAFGANMLAASAYGTAVTISKDQGD